MRSFVLAAVVAVSACSPSGYIEGTVDGETIQVRDSVFVPIHLNGQVSMGVIYVVDQPDFCKSLRAGRLPRKTQGVNVAVFRLQDSNLIPPAEGEYSVPTKYSSSKGNY